MTWDPNSGGFTPGGSGQRTLYGVDSGSKGVTVQDLINLGLIDANGRSMAGRSLGGAILNPSDTRLAQSISAILQDSASSIELNSPTLFKKMNGAAGVVIGSAGIAGYNSAGTATFTLDPETGSVTLSGTVTATAGVIGGWTLGATSLTAGSGATTVGIDSGGTNPAFYAGSATPGSAPFRVTAAGSAVVESISINANGTLTNAGGGAVTAVGISAIQTSLGNAPAGIINSNITINASGTLSGAGAGSVTITGLGYTGTLNATTNTMYNQALDPGGVNGDTWYDTTSTTFKIKVASAWVSVGDITSGKVAASISGQGALATLNQVAAAQIAAGAVGTTQLASLAVTTAIIANAAVGTTQIANAAVTSALLASGAVGIVNMASGLRPVEILGTLGAAGTQGRTVFLTTDNKLYRDTGAAWTVAVAGADIVANSITAGQIAAATITTTQIAASTIIAGNIAAGTITGALISAATIAASNIISGTITGTQIAATTIAAGNIVANTITAAQIAANTITAAQIAAGTITAAEMTVATLSAISANLGTITAGSMSGITLAIGSANAIFKADANGIYLGNATFASAPFRVDMAGALVSSSGTIGGFTIDSDNIRNSGNAFGLSSANENGSLSIRIWSGTTFANRANASFRVDEQGSIWAGNIAGATTTVGNIICTGLKPDTNGTRDIGDGTHYVNVVYTVYTQCGGTIFANGAYNQTTSTQGMISHHGSHDLAAGAYKLGLVPATGTAPYLYINIGGKVCLFIDATGAGTAC